MNMIIVGEKINTSRKSIAAAVEAQDVDFISEVAREQAEAGAHYIDVNAGTFLDQEIDYLCWLVEVVQNEVDLPLCLDSPNPKALSEAIKHHKGEAMINSISLEKDRYEALLHEELLVAKYGPTLSPRPDLVELDLVWVFGVVVPAEHRPELRAEWWKLCVVHMLLHDAQHQVSVCGET